MLSREDNELLVRVGPHTGMGQLLRRFWIPVLLSSEVAQAQGDPVRVHVLGEKFVAFRDAEGRLGLLDAYCTHRRANLYWGRNDPGGLRCVYHGWQFDVDGRCVDLPNNPDGDRVKANMNTRAWPVREMGGLVWAYFGPPELMPEPPATEMFGVPESHRYVSKFIVRGNWMQFMEGDIDSSHVSFLHSDPSLIKNLRDAGRSSGDHMILDKQPRWVVKPTGYGFMLAAQRDAGPDDYVWRVNQWLMPFSTMVAARDDTPNVAIARVPIDDETTMSFRLYAHPDRPLTRAEYDYTQAGIFFPDLIPGTFTPTENEDNEYLIDRAKQRAGSFTGIKSFVAQDLAVAQDQGGLIADRSLEKLMQSDTAIVNVRRRLLEAVKALQRGQEPVEPRQPEAYRVRPLEIVLPRSVDIVDGGRAGMRLPPDLQA